jgi:hypothetical protein
LVKDRTGTFMSAMPVACRRLVFDQRGFNIFTDVFQIPQAGNCLL